MTQAQFREVMKKISGPETSFDLKGWSYNNPLWGHCGVISLLAQEEFGGELVQGSLKQYPQYVHLKSHIWNQIDGHDIDFTQEQYRDISYKDLRGKIVPREDILDNENIIKRLSILKKKFIESASNKQ